jgi:ADP-ribose pyrophosphatase YjhB (NUDIX family)
VLHAAAGILRRGDELVLVREAGPGEEPSWALPGGMIEEGELVTEGLAREVLEETGLRVERIDRLAFVTQVDVRQRDRHRAPLDEGYHLTVWTFEIGSWSGEPAVGDPDGFVSEVALVSLAEAPARLESGPKSESGLVGPYVRGEVEPGSLHLFRRHEDGVLEALDSVPRTRRRP